MDTPVVDQLVKTYSSTSADAGCRLEDLRVVDKREREREREGERERERVSKWSVQPAQFGDNDDYIVGKPVNESERYELQSKKKQVLRR